MRENNLSLLSWSYIPFWQHISMILMLMLINTWLWQRAIIGLFFSTKQKHTIHQGWIYFKRLIPEKKWTWLTSPECSRPYSKISHSASSFVFSSREPSNSSTCAFSSYLAIWFVFYCKQICLFSQHHFHKNSQ